MEVQEEIRHVDLDQAFEFVEQGGEFGETRTIHIAKLISLYQRYQNPKGILLIQVVDEMTTDKAHTLTIADIRIEIGIGAQNITKRVLAVVGERGDTKMYKVSNQRYVENNNS